MIRDTLLLLSGNIWKKSWHLQIKNVVLMGRIAKCTKHSKSSTNNNEILLKTSNNNTDPNVI